MKTSKHTKKRTLKRGGRRTLRKSNKQILKRKSSKRSARNTKSKKLRGGDIGDILAGSFDHQALKSGLDSVAKVAGKGVKKLTKGFTKIKNKFLKTNPPKCICDNHPTKKYCCPWKEECVADILKDCNQVPLNERGKQLQIIEQSAQ